MQMELNLTAWSTNLVQYLLLNLSSTFFFFKEKPRLRKLKSKGKLACRKRLFARNFLRKSENTVYCVPVIKQFLISKAVKSHKTKLNKLHHFKAVNKINNMWFKNNRGWCIYEEDLWAWSYARTGWIISSQLLTTGLSSLAVTYVEKQLSRFEPPSLSDGVTKPLCPQSKSQKRGCWL